MLTPPFDPARPDLCVVGAGTAGHALALAAAALGLRCTVVDPRERLGAGQAADRLDAAVLGAASARDPRDWRAVARQASIGVARAAQDHAAERLRTLGVAVITAAPRFTDHRTLLAASLEIRARRFVLATGAAGVAPASPLAGVDATGALTPGRLLAAALPDRIAVVTDQPRGLEWAQALARFGSRVTLLATPGALAFEPELAGFVLAGLRRDGVELQLDAGPAALAAACRNECPRLVFAAGQPATAGLDLAAAGVALDPRGAPLVDTRLRTGNRAIAALGDVIGSAPGRSVEAEVGVVLRAVVAGLPDPRPPVASPVLLRTVPPVAQVGRLDRGRLWRAPLAAPSGPGLAMLATDRRGRVAGAGLAGPGAAEAVAAAALAIARGLPGRALAELPGTAPATEALRRAALAALADGLRRPAVLRLIAWRQRLP